MIDLIPLFSFTTNILRISKANLFLKYFLLLKRLSPLIKDIVTLFNF